jgi:hypothetical protein
MMRAGVLFSGGKDSALAALLLAPHYEVEAITFASGAGRDLAAVEAAGEALGLAWRRAPFPEGLLAAAVDRLIADGYPNNAINLVHRRALEALAREYPVVADGTRFDDRVPMLGPDEARAGLEGHGRAWLTLEHARETREAAGAVAAHLSLAAVGVEIAHHELGAAVPARFHEHKPIRADAKVAVTEPGNAVPVDGQHALAVVEHHEIVARPSHLCER